MSEVLEVTVLSTCSTLRPVLNIERKIKMECIKCDSGETQETVTFKAHFNVRALAPYMNLCTFLNVYKMPIVGEEEEEQEEKWESYKTVGEI